MAAQLPLSDTTGSDAESIGDEDTRIRISFDNVENRERNKQYFRFNDEEMEEQAWLLMEKEDLTAQDILAFCNGKKFGLEKDNAIQLAYRARRLEIFDLLKKLKTGDAIVDQDGRLRSADGLSQAARNGLPVLPPIPPPRNQPAGGIRDAGLENANEGPGVGGEHQQQQQRLAEAAIARAVERYRQQRVPMDTVELIELPIPEPTIHPPLTFRRIVIAVIAVVLAFLFMLLQTLSRPSHPRSSMAPPYTEILLQSREFLNHVKECALEDRNWTKPASWTKWWAAAELPTSTCGGGVLMVPSTNSIIRKMVKAVSLSDVNVWERYIVPEVGVNVTWWMPCEPVDSNDQCSTCFRGIHDEIVPQFEVKRAISLGEALIENGGDHFDVHTNINPLRKTLPELVERLEGLLQTQYMIADPQIVAFRVHASAPMNGDGVQSSNLKHLLNRTNYRQWMENASYQNRLAAHFPIPWPLTLFSPVRDTCNLLADQQANPSFEIHTTIFLSEERTSGFLLYVDEIKKLVTRGLAVESSPGRIVVSTGGLENQRCRIPPNSGISASLQIWWRAGGGIDSIT